jgi:hypothetical protein
MALHPRATPRMGAEERFRKMVGCNELCMLRAPLDEPDADVEGNVM